MGPPVGHREHRDSTTRNTTGNRRVDFSIDGNYLYLIKRDESIGLGTLFQVPSLGGAPTQRVVDVDSPISFSPDGKRFVFVRQSSKTKTSNLIIANADGTGEKILSTLNNPAYFSTNGPAWSPDGARIAVAETPDGDFNNYKLETIAVDSGTRRPWVRGIGAILAR